MTNLKTEISPHYFQNYVAANGVSHQDEVCLLWDMLPDEGQLVFYLTVQTKRVQISR